MARVYERWGPLVLPRELDDIRFENTPQYDIYEDKIQNKHSFPHLAEELEPMPEKVHHYKGADIHLPRGNKMARGHAVAQSHDVSGYIIDRAHKIQLLTLECIKLSLLEARLEN